MSEPQHRDVSFGRLTFDKAVSDTAQFLKYTKRDIVLGSITLLLGFALAYGFVGKADTTKEIVFIAAFTFAPAIIVMCAIFAWHLWLAPSALIYGAGSDTHRTMIPRSVNWLPWKQRDEYDLTELAAILTRDDPTRALTQPSMGCLALVKEATMNRRLPYKRGHLAESYQTPELWPTHFKIQKADAIKWAEANGFDVSHVK